MENKNVDMVREWKDDPDCFLRMLDSPSQRRKRNDRRQKDLDRERIDSMMYGASLCVLVFVFAMAMFVICTTS